MGNLVKRSFGHTYGHVGHANISCECGGSITFYDTELAYCSKCKQEYYVRGSRGQYRLQPIGEPIPFGLGVLLDK
jgi:hypothetical protein